MLRIRLKPSNPSGALAWFWASGLGYRAFGANVRAGMISNGRTSQLLLYSECNCIYFILRHYAPLPSIQASLLPFTYIAGIGACSFRKFCDD